MRKTNLNIAGLLAFFGIIFIMNACSIESDNNLTDSDIFGDELEEIIEENEISTASVYLLNTEYQGDVEYYRRHNQEYFTLHDAFIQVDDIYYSLDKLAKYEVRESNDGNYLMFYFDIYL